MEIACIIMVIEVLIRGTEKFLAKDEVEGILVEEDEDQLFVIIVINLDTFPNIFKILVPHAHIIEH